MKSKVVEQMIAADGVSKADANAAFNSFGQSYAGGSTPQPLGA